MDHQPPSQPSEASVPAGPAPAPTPPTVPPVGADQTVRPEDPKIEELKDAIRDVYDPEIPINVLDLGLIYRVAEKDGAVEIDMTLTSPICPVGDQLKARVAEVIRGVKWVKQVNVQLVYEPPWDKEKMTFEGKLQASMLGFM